MEFQIVVFDKTTGVASVMIPAVPRIIRGMEKLTQIVVLSYLSNRGQDVMDPLEGSDLRAAIGTYNVSSADAGEVRGYMIQRTKFVESEVIERQKTEEGAADEKLKKLQVLDVAYDPSTSQALLRVQIINEAGDSVDVVV